MVYPMPFLVFCDLSMLWFQRQMLTLMSFFRTLLDFDTGTTNLSGQDVNFQSGATKFAVATITMLNSAVLVIQNQDLNTSVPAHKLPSSHVLNMSST